MRSISDSWSGEPYEFPDTSAGALQELICIHGSDTTVKYIEDENAHYAQEWAGMAGQGQPYLGYPV